jgi:hypothetical protein
MCLPCFDAGGVLAGSAEAEPLLLRQGIELARWLAADAVELPQYHPLLREGGPGAPADATAWRISPDPTAGKVRSQIHKAMKSGPTLRCGGTELLDDFYGVFV